MTTRKRVQYLMMCGVVASLAGALATDGGPRRRPRQKLSSRAKIDAASRRAGDKMEVIVRFTKAPGAVERSLIQGFVGQVRRSFRTNSRWMSLRLPAHVVAKLADNPNVDFIAADPPITSAMDVARVAAGEAPANTYEGTLKGSG